MRVRQANLTAGVDAAKYSKVPGPQHLAPEEVAASSERGGNPDPWVDPTSRSTLGTRDFQARVLCSTFWILPGVWEQRCLLTGFGCRQLDEYRLQ